MRKLDQLKIWGKGLDLCEEVYEMSKKFPDEEKYGLKSQIRRAAVSIPSNIAEGAGRNSNKEFAQFLSIANGSSYEVQTQIMLARKFNYVNEVETKRVLENLDEIQKMNFGLQSHLRKTQNSFLKTQN